MIRKNLFIVLGILIICQPSFADTKAKRISVEASGFTGNLSPSDSDVQKALDTIDGKSFVVTTGDTMTGPLILDDTSLQIQEGVDTMTITVPVLTAARAVTLPDAAGEMSLLGQQIDISTETNLAAGTGITLTDDTLSVDLGSSVDISDETNLAATAPVTLTGDTIGLNQGGIDHGIISGLGDDDHPQYVLDSGDTMTDTLTIDRASAGNVLILDSELSLGQSQYITFRNQGGERGSIDHIFSASASYDIAINGFFGVKNEGLRVKHDGSLIFAGTPNCPGGLETDSSGIVSCHTDQVLNLAGVETITGNWVNTANPWADDEVADDITVSNYLPLAGGILTGPLILDDTSMQIQEGVDTLTITVPVLTAGRTVTFPDAAGEVSLLGQLIDISDETNLAAGTGISLVGDSISATLGDSIDISSETNLAVTAPITLTGDTIGINQGAVDHGGLAGLGDDDHSQYVLDAGDAMTGPLVLDDTSLQIQEGVDTLTITVPVLTGARAVTFPDADGELSLLGQQIDISDETNLIAGTGITLTGDSLSVDLGDSIDISSETNLAVTAPITLTGDTVGLNQGGVDHGGLAGLGDDDHTQYVFLAGRTGGQIIYGGINLGDDLTFRTTSNPTKGSYIFPELTDCDTIDTDSSGVLSCGTDASGSGGTANILDLGDDETNESVDLIEIATSGDTNNIFTEPSADKLLIDVSQNWPTADLANDLSCTDCLNQTEIEDIYVLTAGDTMTGPLVMDDTSLQIQEGVDTLTLSVPVLTVGRAVTFPDAAGEVSLLGQLIDISDETNLIAGTGITLTGDSLSVDLGDSIDISSETNLAVTAPITLTGDTVGLNQGGVDHGNLAGLGDDDHPQYVLDAGDTMTGPLVLDDTSIQIQEGVDTLTITVPSLTAARAVTFPDGAGEISLLGQSIDISDETNLAVTAPITLTDDTIGVGSASDTVQGVVELATTAETTTGSDSTRAVTPDGLAGSFFGKRETQMVVFDFTTDVETGDGKFYFHIGEVLNGMNLVYVHAKVITAGTTGTTDIQVHNVTDTVDILSTKLTIDSGETGADTAATPAVINTSNDDVVENDLLRIDIDAVSTTAPKGLIITCGFQLP